MRSNLVLLAAVLSLVSCSRREPVETIQYETQVAVRVTGYSVENGTVTLLNMGQPVRHISRPSEIDRAYGQVLLLDVEPKHIDDGNSHIVYDMSKESVIGYFTWYNQG